MRPDAWCFREEGGVDIPRSPARLSRQVDGLAQEVLTIRVTESLVTRWKVPTDVTERRRAEHGVGDGVEQDVGVGVPVQPLIVRDLDAAED
jgi:hypothetical protein